MRVIGVIDLLGGRAVHAHGGRRESYGPVESVAGARVDGDARRLAERYRSLGVAELYVADLDAIGGGRRHDDLIGGLAALGAPVWLDAGIASASGGRECLALGVAQVVVGLETLDSWEALTGVAAAAGPERTVFSLDLRDGVPVAMTTLQPVEIAEQAVRAGAGSVIVLDLARVGTGRGPDVDLLARVRDALPGIPLIAGGGVRDGSDLESLGAAGCDAALVATALHKGVASHLLRTAR